MMINGMERAVTPAHFLDRITVCKMSLKRGRNRGMFYQYIDEIHPAWGANLCDPFPGVPEPDPDYVPPYDPYASRPKRMKWTDPDGILYNWGYAVVRSTDGWVQLQCIGYMWHPNGKGFDLQLKILDCVGSTKLIGKVTRAAGILSELGEKTRILDRLYMMFGFDCTPD